MRVMGWLARIGGIAVALCLTGCPSLGPRAQAPASIDSAQALASAGDQAGAGRMYERLAEENSGSDRDEYLIRAAQAYVAANRPEDAARALAGLDAGVTARQATEQALLEVELALARGQAAQAWQRISALPAPSDPPAAAARYWRLRERAALAANRTTDAVQSQLALERWIEAAPELRASRVELLDALRDAANRGAKFDLQGAPDATVRGWLELGPIAAAAARNPNVATADVDAWRSRYPTHPAGDIVRSELLGNTIQQAQMPISPGAHIALLLPLSGRQAPAGISVRDGFLTAYYSSPAAQRAAVRIYDTEEAGTPAAIAHATQEGARIVVGPLTREEVVAAAAVATQRPPILALNYLPPDRPAPQAFFQYALSPENEARIVARRVLADGHRHGIALVPAGDWGNRVLSAFTQELQAGGGTLFSSAVLDSGITDYSDAITQVLRINDSNARRRRLEGVLGTKLQFEPRRRADLEFIFAPAQASMERLLRPQLRFHFAGDVPTYATSDAFDPDPRNNQDLEGLMFPDMPWMLGGDLAQAVRNATQNAWPVGGPRRGRLFAFGFDAYRLGAALQEGAAPSSVHIEGLTGTLSLDADGRFHRELEWAQIHDGELRLLPEPNPQSSAP